MSVRLRLIIGIPFFALMFFYLGLRVYSRVALQDYSLRGWNAEWRDGRAVIADVIPNSPATGVLRKGDVVVAFWSERPDATPLVTPDYWRVPPGTRYKLTVSRDGQSLELPLQTNRIPYGGPSSGDLYFFYMLTFLLFITTGVTVFLLRPGDEQAWLLALMLTTPVALLSLNIGYLQLPRWIYLAAFQQSSRALKRMNLRSLFMAMTIAKVKDYQLTIGSAGMPPVLIYRAAQRVVEEISLRGVPLGSLTAYSYRERSLNLAPGDVVVLMSDGYPERFNGKNEMLDYGSAKSVLLEIAILPPQEIIEVFVKVADKWADGRPQDDDVTFVVLKVK